MIRNIKEAKSAQVTNFVDSLENCLMETCDISTIEIPERLIHRARNDFGIPIPGIIYVDKEKDLPNNNYNMHPMINCDALDWNAWAACVNSKRCGYCRHPLDYWMYFIGGQKEVQNNIFMNPPMHDSCVMYYSQLYPHVFMPRMRNAPIAEFGELPIRLGIYKTRTFKIFEMDVITKGQPNYALQGGTQAGPTLWMDYPRDFMNELHATWMNIRRIMAMTQVQIATKMT